MCSVCFDLHCCGVHNWLLRFSVLQDWARLGNDPAQASGTVVRRLREKENQGIPDGTRDVYFHKEICLEVRDTAISEATDTVTKVLVDIVLFRLRVIIFFGVMDTACVKARNKIRFEVRDPVCFKLKNYCSITILLNFRGTVNLDMRDDVCFVGMNTICLAT